MGGGCIEVCLCMGGESDDWDSDGVGGDMTVGLDV